MTGFKEIPAEQLGINPFAAIGSEWMLITAQKGERVNAMTASWGGLGRMWNRNVAFTVPSRSRFSAAGKRRRWGTWGRRRAGTRIRLPARGSPSSTTGRSRTLRRPGRCSFAKSCLRSRTARSPSSRRGSTPNSTPNRTTIPSIYPRYLRYWSGSNLQGNSKGARPCIGRAPFGGCVKRNSAIPAFKV